MIKQAPAKHARKPSISLIAESTSLLQAKIARSGIRLAKGVIRGEDGLIYEVTAFAEVAEAFEALQKGEKASFRIEFENTADQLAGVGILRRCYPVKKPKGKKPLSPLGEKLEEYALQQGAVVVPLVFSSGKKGYELVQFADAHEGRRKIDFIMDMLGEEFVGGAMREYLKDIGGPEQMNAKGNRQRYLNFIEELMNIVRTGGIL